MACRMWLTCLAVLAFACAAASAAAAPAAAPPKPAAPKPTAPSATAPKPTPPAPAVPKVTLPFERASWSIPENSVDLRVQATLKARGATLRNQCSDDVFIRRIYIDMIGTLPTRSEVETFLADLRPNKRALVIDSLFAREEFADYWAMKWCDTLRVKSEFPMNLWPKAAQAYHRWIWEAIRDNMPYDQFVRELLSASGSNFRVPQVNFYRALATRDPAGIARGAALTFMGTRLEKWPPDRAKELTVFFSRIAYKRTDEWKEEIVYPNPEPCGLVKAGFPDGTKVMIGPDDDPRAIFTDWLIRSDNQWFTYTIGNRLWSWIMGHGIIYEADDLRPDNPPASPETLSCLAGELIKNRFDLRSVYRLIFNSRTYQQSSLPNNDTKDPKIQFAYYTIRRLDAEVLLDALCWIGGSGIGYFSATPEPWTYIPKENRTVTLADGSITNTYLTLFGRSTRDTGLDNERNHSPSDTQRLYLLNSTEMHNRITQSPRLREIILGSKDTAAIIRGLYVTILSRYPTPAEAALCTEYYTKSGMDKGPTSNDIAWSLINSKEFLYRH
ncbi:MAG: DUF1553 domain-containing protein [Armatimonadota bacterium]